jgi:MOSC domain-containing protein YiiM
VTIPRELTRRNLVVRGVYLNHLVGRELRVGEVVLRGVRLCEPCKHLEEVSGLRGAMRLLAHRGGLRCDVVRGGVVRRGDAVHV